MRLKDLWSSKTRFKLSTARPLRRSWITLKIFLNSRRMWMELRGPIRQSRGALKSLVELPGLPRS